jgi:hypothetical protein
MIASREHVSRGGLARKTILTKGTRLTTHQTDEERHDALKVVGRLLGLAAHAQIVVRRLRMRTTFNP